MNRSYEARLRNSRVAREFVQDAVQHWQSEKFGDHVPDRATRLAWKSDLCAQAVPPLTEGRLSRTRRGSG